MPKVLEITACFYCPHHLYIPGLNSSPVRRECLNCTSKKIIQAGELVNGFPTWCPLPDAKGEEILR